MKKYLILAIMVLTLLVPTAVMAADVVVLDTTVVAQVVSFEITPSYVNFGAVIVGVYSEVRTFTVHNSGNVNITIAASTASDFYYNRMEISVDGVSYMPVSSFSAFPIAVEGTPTIYVRVKPMSGDTIGLNNGSLTFIATPVTP